jgi:hypothetical protein
MHDRPRIGCTEDHQGEAMTSRLGLLAAVCAAAGVLAGCGGTKTVTVTTPTTTPSAGVTTPTTTTTPATGTTSPTTTTTTTTPTSTSTVPTAAQLKAAEAANPQFKKELAQAVTSCKSSVAATPSLKAADRSKLAAICDQMSSGDTSAVQSATAQVCQQIIKDSVPAASQAQALAACPKP